MGVRRTVNEPVREGVVESERGEVLELSRREHGRPGRERGRGHRCRWKGKKGKSVSELKASFGSGRRRTKRTPERGEGWCGCDLEKVRTNARTQVDKLRTDAEAFPLMIASRRVRRKLLSVARLPFVGENKVGLGETL